MTLDFDAPCSLSAVVLREDITQGQRIDAVDVYVDGQLLAHRESVGYQRIIRFDEPVTARQVVIRIPGFRTRVHLRVRHRSGGLTCPCSAATRPHP